jgi:hypothetical protein
VDNFVQTQTCKRAQRIPREISTKAIGADTKKGHVRRREKRNTSDLLTQRIIWAVGILVHDETRKQLSIDL